MKTLNQHQIETDMTVQKAKKVIRNCKRNPSGEYLIKNKQEKEAAHVIARDYDKKFKIESKTFDEYLIN